MYLQADAAKIALELPKEKKYFSLEELVPLQSKFSQRMFNGTWISGMIFFIKKIISLIEIIL